MRSIWAVATNTIKQAVRMKVAAVFIILLLVLLPVMGLTTTGDETLKGRLQTFVSYGLSLTSLLLCLLTIIVSIYSVTSDIEQRQIYTVITKPIRRFEFLLGKLLGVVLLDVILLSLFAAIIYTIIIYTPKFFKVTEAELSKLERKYSEALQAELSKLGANYSEVLEARLLQNSADLSKLKMDVLELEDKLTRVNNEFFTARDALPVDEVDVTKKVTDRYEQLEISKRLPPALSRKEIIAELTKQAQLAKRAADVGQVLVWEFKNVEPLAESMFIKFKYDVWPNPPDSQVYGIWYAGDPQYIKYGEQPKTPVYDRAHKHSVRTFHEIEFSADVVPEHGRLAVAFLNDPERNNVTVIFPPDGIEVLYKADTFTANFIRVVLLILLRLIFLACLGILASTFLSFPVAILLCLVLFSTACVSGFVLESFSFLSENISEIYSYTLKWIIRLLPQFDKFNPTKFLVPARLLSWSLLGRCAAVMVCIKAFLLLVLAIIIFSYREIAKIII